MGTSDNIQHISGERRARHSPRLAQDRGVSKFHLQGFHVMGGKPEGLVPIIEWLQISSFLQSMYYTSHIHKYVYVSKPISLIHHEHYLRLISYILSICTILQIQHPNKKKIYFICVIYLDILINVVTSVISQWIGPELRDFPSSWRLGIEGQQLHAAVAAAHPQFLIPERPPAQLGESHGLWLVSGQRIRGIFFDIFLPPEKRKRIILLTLAFFGNKQQTIKQHNKRDLDEL